MDGVLSSLVDFVESTSFDEFSQSAIDRVVRHTVDAVGCGAGGFASAPARAAREVIRGSAGPFVASVYGEDEPVLVDFAAFANATANRYLDFNDFGVSGHPSDMIPALLAMTEATGAPGRDAVVAIYLAYELATRLAEAVPPDGGWDQGIYCSLAVAAGLSKILKLSREQTANALSLAVVPNIPLRVTRFGELSEWKAAATGRAAADATFAVRLAAQGMTGPPAPFEGKDGILERVWITFDADLTSTKAPSAIERASLKRFPACYWGQVPVDLMSQLRVKVDRSRVQAIDVATCEAAWRTIGGGRGDAAEKWRPRTRETADHSMPYLLAVALVDGRLDDDSFAADRLTDPELIALMDATRVVERPDLTARATRDRCPTEMTIQLKDGSSVTASSEVPRGHHANPMTDTEVQAKFDELAARALKPPEARELADGLWNLAQLDSLAPVGKLFRAFAVQ